MKFTKDYLIIYSATETILTESNRKLAMTFKGSNLVRHFVFRENWCHFRNLKKVTIYLFIYGSHYCYCFFIVIIIIIIIIIIVVAVAVVVVVVCMNYSSLKTFSLKELEDFVKFTYI